MRLLGAEVVGVDAGARTLKEAVSARRSATGSRTSASTHYIIGSCVGPAPYPALVRDLQRRIGDEARAQLLERTGALPDRVIACVGGGSNAIGTFIPFVDDDGGRADRRGGGRRGPRHAASLGAAHHRRARRAARRACPRCCRTRRARSSRRTPSPPGSTIPASGPEHAWLRDSGRVRYVAVPDGAALARSGPWPSARASCRRSSPRTRWPGCSPTRAPGVDLVTLSGRGDKDLAEVLALEDSR